VKIGRARLARKEKLEGPTMNELPANGKLVFPLLSARLTSNCHSHSSMIFLKEKIRIGNRGCVLLAGNADVPSYWLLLPKLRRTTDYDNKIEHRVQRRFVRGDSTPKWYYRHRPPPTKVRLGSFPQVETFLVIGNPHLPNLI
jgi:hypothetical protein